jgi:hypothetical protein
MILPASVVAVGAFADPGRRGRRLPAPSGKRARPLQVTTPTDGFQGEARERESSVLVVDLTVELPPEEARPVLPPWPRARFCSRAARGRGRKPSCPAPNLQRVSNALLFACRLRIHFTPRFTFN